MKVLVVESPAKAKAISKYLGSEYTVFASYGHIRDLPSKKGSVDPDHGFRMTWDLSQGARKNLQKIEEAVKRASALYLATDPDREGEAIAWHLYEVLQEKKLLGSVTVHRSVFNEITKKAVLDAIQSPRTLNQGLIDAYLTRRALDYLVGFTLSPVLWHKLPGSKSAGRVQSVALRLIVDREREIELFDSKEYWTIEAQFLSKENKSFIAKLSEFRGEKVQKFSFPTKLSTEEVLTAIEARSFSIENLEKKRVQRNPQPPFTTSTLQQEASRKLGFGASRTMRLAQELYEGVSLGGETVGLITYMRTDSVGLSQSAQADVRNFVSSFYGASYVPGEPRFYKNKSKNAQEAHEAIRPTGMDRVPEKISSFLSKDHFRLYDLIWKRTVASQMENAQFDQTTAHVTSDDRTVLMKSTGSVLVFDGFLRVYQVSHDEGEEGDEDQDRLLPSLHIGDVAQREKTIPTQHFTQPPPRFSEASLVKKLEELGIGRPSTYASILQVLQTRSYVRLEKKQFVPDMRGRLVSLFLVHYFHRYVEYDFTAHMEDVLDDVAQGDVGWIPTMQEFWVNFKQAVDQTKDLKISDVLDMLNKELEHRLFEKDASGHVVTKCPSCEKGHLHLKLGKYGAFLGCDSYPACPYTRQLTGAQESKTALEENASSDSFPSDYPKILGINPATGAEVSLRKGPYGFYVQENHSQPSSKPKRSSLPKQLVPEDLTLEKAIQLMALPREIGHHPKTQEMMLAGIGRYGPYIKHGGTFISVKDKDILTLTAREAVDIIEASLEKKNKG